MRRGRWLWAVIGCALLLHTPFLLQRVALERSNDTVELVLDYDDARRVAEDGGVPIDELLAEGRRLGITSVALDGSEEPVRMFGRVVPRTFPAARAAVHSGLSVGPYIPRHDEFEDGLRHKLDALAAGVARLRVPFGLVEFVHMPGVHDVARALDYNVVFAHSIPPKELARLTYDEAVARFHRAVFERQARLLYIHLKTGDGPDLVLQNTNYMTALVDTVQRSGLRIGPAEPAPRWTTPWSLLLASAVATGAAAVLTMGPVAWGRPGRRGGRRGGSPLLAAGFIVAPCLLVAGLLSLGHDVLVRQGIAAAAAIIFPVLAIRMTTGRVESEPGHTIDANGLARAGMAERGGRVARVLIGLVTVLSVSGLGAAFVVGALGDTSFLLKLEQFRGVKLVHVLPFVILAALWGTGAGRRRGRLSPVDDAAAAGAGKSPSTPEARSRFQWTWTRVALGLCVLVFGFIFVARTGHDVLPVSDVERALREGLERALPVRPRTKEFLFGYPALLLGLWLASAPAADGRFRFLARPLLILGAIAPVSVINTFAHAHIPLSVSVMRSGFGLLLGGFIGLLAIGIFRIVMLRGARGCGVMNSS